jgi:hypothetical protein
MSYGTESPQNAGSARRKRKTVIDGPFTESKELIGGTGTPGEPASVEAGRDRPE